MRFDPTINLGHVVMISGFLFGGVTAYYGLDKSLNNHEWRLDNVEEIMKDQNSINRTTAEALAQISRDLAVIRARSDPLGQTPARGK